MCLALFNIDGHSPVPIGPFELRRPKKKEEKKERKINILCPAKIGIPHEPCGVRGDKPGEWGPLTAVPSPRAIRQRFTPIHPDATDNAMPYLHT